MTDVLWVTDAEEVGKNQNAHGDVSARNSRKCSVT